MRVVGGTVSAMCLALAAHAGALAQTQTSAARPLDLTPSSVDATRSFTDKAFAVPAFPTQAGFAPRDLDSAEARIAGLFAVSPAGGGGGDARLDADRYDRDRGPVAWRSSGFTVAKAHGAVDTVRISTAAVAKTARVAPLSLVRPDAPAYDTQAVDISVSRGWPEAMKLAAGRYALDVSPHAGLGFGGAGGSAEAGATLRFGRDIEDRVSGALGVRDGRQAFGDRGRWYLFAAASGQAVGMNMLRGEDGDWSRAGVTSDVSSKLIGDAQAGVGWRRGPMQASVGYIHRKIKAKDQIMGMATQEDSLVAVSFSLKPHW